MEAAGAAHAEDFLDAITGRYAVGGVGAVTIFETDRRAFVRIEDGIEYPVFFVGDGQLYVPGLDVWIGFPAAPAGPYERMAWLSISHGGEGPRVR